MLEGQVNVLGAGVLSAEERRRRPRCALRERHVPAGSAQLHALPGPSPAVVPGQEPRSRRGRPSQSAPDALVAAGRSVVIVTDADGRYRFNADLTNEGDCGRPLDRLGRRRSMERSRDDDTVARFSTSTSGCSTTTPSRAVPGRCTGTRGSDRSTGTWSPSCSSPCRNRSSKPAMRGRTTGNRGPPHRRLLAGSRRAGIQQDGREYGAFPTDPYSHTPAHAGAQQPGMTGQVKEELLTRPARVGHPGRRRRDLLRSGAAASRRVPSGTGDMAHTAHRRHELRDRPSGRFPRAHPAKFRSSWRSRAVRQPWRSPWPMAGGSAV